MNEKPRYSVVVPCFNEEGVLHELYRRVQQVMDQTGDAWELVLVNDGSHDRTLQIMRELHAADPRVKAVDFARNFGHQIAFTAGVDFAQGEAVEMDQQLFKQQFKAQTGKGLLPVISSSQRKTHSRYQVFSSTKYRISRARFKEFLNHSLVNIYTYEFKSALPHLGRGFVCNDFAVNLWSEIKKSIWKEMAIAIVAVPGHRINLVWFSDDERIYYLEPQRDRLWLPHAGTR